LLTSCVTSRSISRARIFSISNLFYQVISTRQSQKRSAIITTNTAFSDWGNIFYNTTIATAVADPLAENSEIFLLGGESLRKDNNKSAASPAAE
jgi:DNA replication protein DnaC